MSPPSSKCLWGRDFPPFSSCRPPTSIATAVLLGGYRGGWLSASTLLGLHLDERQVRQVGASLGNGVVALLPATACPLAEVARVVRYMAGQGDGQCGPCRHGLASLVEEVEHCAFGPASYHRGVRPMLELCDLIDGRGACQHPDGIARFVRSACGVFGHEIAAHQERGPCSRAAGPTHLPIPQATGPQPSGGRR